MKDPIKLLPDYERKLLNIDQERMAFTSFQNNSRTESLNRDQIFNDLHLLLEEKILELK